MSHRGANGSGYYTTGQVARLVGVAPRTVTKWTDSGKLRCRRVPESRDRRIRKEDLEEFLRQRGYGPEADALEGRVGAVNVLAYGVDCYLSGLPTPHLALTEMEAGMLAERLRPAVVVVGPGAGRTSATTVLHHLTGVPYKPRLLLVLPDDGAEGWPTHLARVAPADRVGLAEAITQALEGRHGSDD